MFGCEQSTSLSLEATTWGDGARRHHLPRSRFGRDRKTGASSHRFIQRTSCPIPPPSANLHPDNRPYRLTFDRRPKSATPSSRITTTFRHTNSISLILLNRHRAQPLFRLASDY